MAEVILPTSKIYFPNLNGLRFIAALMVIIHHVEQILSIFGHKNYWGNLVIESIGGLGVELFFVLSGFLITYLLLVEEQKTATISIKDFYLRRVLRIWPLYYTIGFLAFFILPLFSVFDLPIYSNQLQANFGFSLLLYTLFLPNLLLASFNIVIPYASQSWSVGVEEQFYLIWPLLMKFFKNKLLILVTVVFIYLFIHFVGFRALKYCGFWNEELQVLRNFWSSFQIHCMAIGGILAYLLFHSHRILNIICNKLVFYGVAVIIIVSILFSIQISYFTREYYAVLFGLLILNLSKTNPTGFLLENRWMNYLGKISYGLYMYHVIAIVVSIKTLEYFNLLNQHLLLIATALTGTILLASISYYGLEKRFIRLKTRYSKIISGDNAISTPKNK